MRLLIEKMPEGGFVVFDAIGLTNGGACMMLHASTTVAAALLFMRDKFEPQAEQPVADQPKAQAAQIGGEKALARSAGAIGPGCLCDSCRHDRGERPRVFDHVRKFEAGADGSVNWAGA